MGFPNAHGIAGGYRLLWDKHVPLLFHVLPFLRTHTHTAVMCLIIAFLRRTIGRRDIIEVMKSNTRCSVIGTIEPGVQIRNMDARNWSCSCEGLVLPM